MTTFDEELVVREEISKFLIGLLIAVDCEFKWTDWSQCTATCGGGTQWRLKNITQNAAYGGSDCKEPFNKTQECNLQSCPGMLVTGV